MTSHTVQGQLGRSVTIDLCEPCQSIWFDPRENLQLTPGATLALFRIIGEHVAKPHVAEGETAKCPHCQARLRRTQDMQRATRFEYFQAVPHEHGRLTTFFDFLKEKDFVRPLTPSADRRAARERPEPSTARIAARSVESRGENSGVRALPIAACRCWICKQAERLVAQLREAADRTGQPVDPALPLALARARRANRQRHSRRCRRTRRHRHEGSSFDLVGAGLDETGAVVESAVLNLSLPISLSPVNITSMGITDFFKGELIEVIEWTDDSRDTLSYRFPDDDKAIKNGAQLIVRESQNVQFVYLGRVRRSPSSRASTR